MDKNIRPRESYSKIEAFSCVTSVIYSIRKRPRDTAAAWLNKGRYDRQI